MQRLDLERIAKALVLKVRSALEPIDARIKALEERAPVPGPVGERGQDGQAGPQGPIGEKGEPGRDAADVDVDSIAVRAAALVQLPVVRDGVDGKDAEPVDLQEVASLAASIVATSKDAVIERLMGTIADLQAQVTELKGTIAALPTPLDGKDADPEVIRAEVAKAVAALPAAKDGANGRDGKDAEAIPLDVVVSLVKDTVADAVAALPVPKDGKDGADGVGVAGALLSHDGELVVTLSNGDVKPIGIVKGQKGDPGNDGRDGIDGLGFDDFDERIDDDGRTVIRTYRAGERSKEIRHAFSHLLYHGVFDQGREYQKNDGVTWGGHLWIAKASTSMKPDFTPESSKFWALAVKAGRPGQKGDPGKDGAPGKDGKDGKLRS
jgi:hypothetical protein